MDSDISTCRLHARQHSCTQDRVELSFAPCNPKHVKASARVILQLDVKNVPTLLVKVYDINTRTYYTTNKSEVSWDTEHACATCCARHVTTGRKLTPASAQLPARVNSINFRGAAANQHLARGTGSHIRAELRLCTLSCNEATPQASLPGRYAGLGCHAANSHNTHLPWFARWTRHLHRQQNPWNFVLCKCRISAVCLSLRQSVVGSKHAQSFTKAACTMLQGSALLALQSPSWMTTCKL